jgi:ribosomal-protein-alanine N-acetyltransferase
MLSFPELHTPRLHLRRITADDIPALLKHGNNANIAKYVRSVPHPYTEPQAVFRISYVLQGFKEKSRYVFAIILKETGELIGETGLHLDNATTAQMGYWIGEEFWNNGLASEAVAAVLKYGFEKLGLEKIYATHHEENPASGKVMVNNNMPYRGMSGSLLTYSMTKEEYEACI